MVFLYVNFHGNRPRWLDRLMLGFTQLGSGLASVILAVVVYWKNPLLSYEILLGTITLWLVVEFLKFLVRRSRPFVRITETRIVGLRARGRSFPSGHTSQAFFAATLLIQYFGLNVWIAILLYIVALLIGITRMYIGAHYPRDVLAGAVLGTVWGLLGTVIESYWQLGVG
jgi:membrane-associated phospholipid phosphatase